MKFEAFGLSDTVLEGIEAMGYDSPTPIQEQAIPLILSGDDMIACAQTGTGKTAAFLLPILSKISQSSGGNINTIVIAPTRELAVQIDQQLQGFSYFTNTSSIAVYGGGDGSAFSQEKTALTDGADVIIATPGKLISHLNMGYVNVSALQHLVLDEADRMLDMGFHDDIIKIIDALPKERQTLLFSATMPENIRSLSKKILKSPKQIDISISKPAEGIMQAAYMTYDNQKVALVKSLLKGKEEIKSVIIFSSTKVKVKELASELKKEGMSAADIHSDLEQSTREEVLRQFKSRQLRIVVATDILARGIDVEDIDLVINYDVPRDGEDYIHRVGRTARAASTGVALTFINEKDQHDFLKIEKLIEMTVPKLNLPPELGDGPEYNPKSKRPHKGKRHFHGKRKKR